MTAIADPFIVNHTWVSVRNVDKCSQAIGDLPSTEKKNNHRVTLSLGLNALYTEHHDWLLYF